MLLPTQNLAMFQHLIIFTLFFDNIFSPTSKSLKASNLSSEGMKIELLASPLLPCLVSWVIVSYFQVKHDVNKFIDVASCHSLRLKSTLVLMLMLFLITLPQHDLHYPPCWLLFYCVLLPDINLLNRVLFQVSTFYDLP